MGVGDASGVSWEDGGVVDLAGDPSLHECHILMSWQLDWLTTTVEPSEGVVTRSWCEHISKDESEMKKKVVYLRSCGHARASCWVADGVSVLLLGMNYLNEIPEVAIVLDNYTVLVSNG